MENHNIKIISLIAILLSINFVFALGVSSPYWKDNPLEMYPGEVREVAFSLVNRIDAETATAFVTLIDGAGIARIISGTEYTVLPGSTDTKVTLKVTIPGNVALGTIYNVKFTVTSAPEGEGTVQLAVKYNVDFPVKVVGKPAVPTPTPPTVQEVPVKTSLPIAWIIIIIAIVVLITFWVLKMQKKK